MPRSRGVLIEHGYILTKGHNGCSKTRACGAIPDERPRPHSTLFGTEHSARPKGTYYASYADCHDRSNPRRGRHDPVFTVRYANGAWNATRRSSGEFTYR